VAGGNGCSRSGTPRDPGTNKLSAKTADGLRGCVDGVSAICDLPSRVHLHGGWHDSDPRSSMKTRSPQLSKAMNMYLRTSNGSRFTLRPGSISFGRSDDEESRSAKTRCRLPMR